jgi:hypothetical protein
MRTGQGSEAALESDKMLMVSTQLGKTGISYSICAFWHFTNGLQMDEENYQIGWIQRMPFTDSNLQKAIGWVCVAEQAKAELSCSTGFDQ